MGRECGVCVSVSCKKGKKRRVKSSGVIIVDVVAKRSQVSTVTEHWEPA